MVFLYYKVSTFLVTLILVVEIETSYPLSFVLPVAIIVGILALLSILIFGILM